MAVSLGEARGSITISTEGVTDAERKVKRASKNMTHDLSGLGKGVGGITDQFRQLDNILGVSFLAGAVVGLGKMTFELGQASAVADLTELSFAKLAQGVGQSSDKLLEGMQKASRGVITDANLIIGANRAIGTGVADTSAELNQILEIARATGIAYGKSTTDAYSRIVEAVGKLEPELLDELGITVRLDQVFRSYAATLGTTADKLTDAQRKQAFLNEIIRQSKDEVAAAAGAGDSAADSYGRFNVATEKLGKSWGDLLNMSGLPLFIGLVSARIDSEIGLIEGYIDLINKAKSAAAGLFGGGGAAVSSATPAWMTGVSPAASGPLLPDRSAEKNLARLDWAEGVNELNTRTHDEIISTEQDFGRQRADTVRDYNKSIAREERDFGIQRLRAEIEQLDSIADVYKDQARREARQIEDLARARGLAQADSAERVAEARKDANEHLVELEEDYQRSRERAADDHRDKLLSAAGRLDAVAVLEERRRYARQTKEAEEAHTEQRDDLQEQLQERLEDEAEALAKSISQQQEAHDRQLADARANDEQRVTDMKADFAKRKAEEDADRALRLSDQAADYAAQLVAMDTAHGERIQQIKDNAAKERTQLDEEARAALAELGVKNKAYDDMIARREANWEKMWDKFMGHVERSLAGTGAVREESYPSYDTGASSSLGGSMNSYAYPQASSTMVSGGNRSVTIGTVAPTIVLGDIGNRSDTDIRRLVMEAITEVFEDI